MAAGKGNHWQPIVCRRQIVRMVWWILLYCFLILYYYKHPAVISKRKKTRTKKNLPRETKPGTKAFLAIIFPANGISRVVRICSCSDCLASLLYHVMKNIWRDTIFINSNKQQRRATSRGSTWQALTSKLGCPVTNREPKANVRNIR